MRLRVVRMSLNLIFLTLEGTGIDGVVTASSSLYELKPHLAHTMQLQHSPESHAYSGVALPTTLVVRLLDDIGEYVCIYNP